MGLPESERIARILVHPHERRRRLRVRPGQAVERQPRPRRLQDRSTAARPGRSSSRAATSRPAAPGLTMDPKNPDVLFAGMWDFRRKGWTFRSGGDGPDAPERQRPVSHRPTAARRGRALTAPRTRDCPAGPWGRVEVDGRAVGSARRLRVHRVDELGALPLRRRRRRPGSGATTARTWSGGRSTSRASSSIPVDPDRLFKPDLQPHRQRRRRPQLRRHVAAARTATGTTSGSIRPTPTHIVGGDDGGLWISWDGGSRWWKVEQPARLAVLPRERRQQGPLPGLRRPAGQQLVGRRLVLSGRHHATSAGRTSTAATASGRWSTRPIPTRSTPSRRAATSGASTGGRTPRATSSRRPRYKEKLRFNWNTPIAVEPHAARARSTSARSSSSARATAATPGSASRPT